MIDNQIEPNSRGMSPAVATIVLIIFAILLGSLVMAFGSDYVENLPDEGPKKSTVCVKITGQDPLKQLQVNYLEGKLSKSQYIAKERQLLR
ncbi:MAG: hypothetical protein QF632_06475 [Candidatus Woesearchaeota archaeon]|jgi:FlaG/FlaF family flagellin (archaellin)|nr:hypothetical protein [Candidatus Woesearchaeota archaeon]MDP7324380.1 hypothetical protein [Candidatus Woesearchaeota archaeon]MDP7457432.1 hypothetical protein [Candidatus Woesearchaeota archaeon]